MLLLSDPVLYACDNNFHHTAPRRLKEALAAGTTAATSWTVAASNTEARARVLSGHR